MTPEPTVFGSQWWEHHYQESPSGRSLPNPQLVAELTDLPVGTALDAGCGEGADAVWLARRGWDVTAVDISPTVVGRAKELADQGLRISWSVADMTVWEPPRQYDLVVSQYVHPDIPFSDFVARLAQAVAPGGTLFVVGHDHGDSRPENASIATDAITRALSTELWVVDVAEVRTRQMRRGSTQRTLEDVVVKAHRKPSELGQLQ